MAIAIPLVVVFSFLLVILGILLHRCWIKIKQSKESRDTEDHDKLSSIYQKVLGMNSSEVLTENDQNLSSGSRYQFTYPHPHSNPYNIYNPQLEGDVSSTIKGWKEY